MSLASGTKLGPYEIQSPLGVAIQNAETLEFGAPAALPIHLNEFATLGPAAPGECLPALKTLSGG